MATAEHAQIRRIVDADQKAARFYASKAQMEGLPTANMNVYSHPMIIGLWFASSYAFASSVGWWPTPGQSGFFAYLSPIPAFACMALPIMFLVEWLHRPYWEKRTHDTLRRRDFIDCVAYYNRSPSSGFWFLEFSGRFVGLIAIDASKDSLSDEVVIKSSPDAANQNPDFSEGTSSTARIRHFYVEEPYRSTSIQDDLLEHALTHTFTHSFNIERVVAREESHVPYVGQALRRQGFRTKSVLEKAGLFKWEVRELVLERANWKGKAKPS
ncbi:hypothetical protein K474DRAFT_1706112 [Panus rudis PR-1116 ss-1]|nr:hypothetical protein K474DRAFT_1706112 [Panus rudis PR-1116 ss-1]